MFLFCNAYKEKMFKIEIEDGHEAPWKPESRGNIFLEKKFPHSLKIPPPPMGKVFFKFFCRLEFSFKRTFSLKINTPLYTFIIVGWVQPPVILRICAPGFNSSFAFTSISSTLPTLPRVLSFIEITLKNTVLAILKNSGKYNSGLSSHWALFTALVLK